MWGSVCAYSKLFLGIKSTEHTPWTGQVQSEWWMIKLRQWKEFKGLKWMFEQRYSRNSEYCNWTVFQTKNNTNICIHCLCLNNSFENQIFGQKKQKCSNPVSHHFDLGNVFTKHLSVPDYWTLNFRKKEENKNQCLSLFK